MNLPQVVRIWLPPAEQHAAWQELTGEKISREEFERLVSESAQAVIAEGGKVEFAEISPAEVKAGLEANGLENTPENRAAVVAAWPEFLGVVLGLKIEVNAIGSALVQGPKIMGLGETPITGTIADAVRKILRQAR